MDVTCSRWEIGYIQFGLMGGLHEGAVRILNADRVGSATLVDYVGVNGEEIVCTTGVSNSCSNWE
jgi:hypothetical protein